MTTDTQRRDDGAGVAHRAWWAGLARVVAAYVVTRIVVLGVAFGVQHPPATTRYVLPTSPLMHWDAGHYLFIAQHGYAGLPPTSEAIAFFPGYSLICRLLMPFVSAETALTIVSHVAGFLGMCLLYIWACRHSGPKIAAWCAGLVCCYPPAMYFSVGYADAVLFLCAAMALLLLENARWFSAAAVSGYATLTRPTGLALAAVVFFYTWFNRRDPKLLRRVVVVLLVGTIAVAGLIAYQGYLWYTFKRPDAFFAAQEAWHADGHKSGSLAKIVTLKPIVEPVFRPIKYIARGDWYRLFEPSRCANPIFNLIILICAVVGLCRPKSVPRVFFLLPILVFLMGYLPDPADGGRLLGIARYQLVALPCFLLLTRWLLAKWGWGWVAAICAGLLAYQGYYMHLFACQVLVS